MRYADDSPALCPACGEPYGDWAFEVDGEMVCEDCFRAWYDDMSDRELAAALGLRAEYRG